MRLKNLLLNNFGLFDNYSASFPKDDSTCTLITGKNNAGKSTILMALRLLAAAMDRAKGSRYTEKFKLPKTALIDISIKRLIHDYEGDGATIQAQFDEDRTIELELNPIDDEVICYFPPHLQKTMRNFLGFIPPLGQISEVESPLGIDHITKHLNTHLAPSHLRNQIHYLLDSSQFQLLQKIIRETWDGIILHPPDHDLESNTISLVYSQCGKYRELACSGQGFQIWVQIIAHMIRLSNKQILVLDEPEIFLHPEKQHVLLRTLKEHHRGSLMIATHSPELMNDIDITHILTVKHDTREAKPLEIRDRQQLEKLRTHLGSSFNMIASQFEDVDLLLVTEQKLDYDIVNQLANSFNIHIKIQNALTDGFSNYKKAIYYKQSYLEFYGKNIPCHLLLDKDYYPDEYLSEIRKELEKEKVNIYFTPGKEIENLFFNEEFLVSLAPEGQEQVIIEFLDNLYRDNCNSCFSRYIAIYKERDKHKDLTTIIENVKPIFDRRWTDKTFRYKLINGKQSLAVVRKFFKDKYNIELTSNTLIEKLARMKDRETRDFIVPLFTI